MPDTDLEVGGGGGGHPDPVFRPFGPQFGFKSKWGGGGGGWPGPSFRSATD